MNDLDHFSCVALHILLEIFFFFGRTVWHVGS